MSSKNTLACSWAWNPQTLLNTCSRKQRYCLKLIWWEKISQAWLLPCPLVSFYGGLSALFLKHLKTQTGFSIGRDCLTLGLERNISASIPAFAFWREGHMPSWVENSLGNFISASCPHVLSLPEQAPATVNLLCSSSKYRYLPMAYGPPSNSVKKNLPALFDNNSSKHIPHV